LYQRKDDNPETVGSHLEVYDKQTAPLIDYYTRKGLIINIQGNDTPQGVFEAIQKELDKLK
jgi:adenylate kinase